MDMGGADRVCIRGLTVFYLFLAFLLPTNSAQSVRCDACSLAPSAARPLSLPAGVTNRQDPLTKRSYNVRAQNSQVRRERSLRY